MEGEYFKPYKKRIRKENTLIDNYMKGEIVWYPGGMDSRSMLLSLAFQGKIESSVVKQVLSSAQGTLKGKPTGELQPNGLPVRANIKLEAEREK